jgi:multidrug efflux pump subunit AcrA (membrane-fusion protein)
MNPRTSIIVVLLAVVAGIGVWRYYDYAISHPNTADAYVGMHRVHVASQVSGPIKELPVHNNQAVTAGQLLLVVIDPTSFELAVRKAEAGASVRMQCGDGGRDAAAATPAAPGQDRHPGRRPSPPAIAVREAAGFPNRAMR